MLRERVPYLGLEVDANLASNIDGRMQGKVSGRHMPSDWVEEVVTGKRLGVLGSLGGRSLFMGGLGWWRWSVDGCGGGWVGGLEGERGEERGERRTISMPFMYDPI